jgi:hypothetical protein
MPDKQNYITLNLSVPAIERLMQECAELMVKLSQGVMEEFARRQVKAFADKAMKGIVQKVIADEMGVLGGTAYAATIKLTPQFEAALKSVVSTQIAALKTELFVDAAARAAGVNTELASMIGPKVESAVNIQVAAYSRPRWPTGSRRC